MALGLGVLALSAATADAGSLPGTGIRGSVHDLSQDTGVGLSLGATGSLTDDPLQRICIYCHAPHHTKRQAADLRYIPLWNHEVTTLTYTPYTSGNGAIGLTGDHETSSIIASIGDISQPVSVSKLCLSCHDGSVGLNAYGLAPVDPILNPASATSFMVNDLGGSFLNGNVRLSTNTKNYLIGEGGDLTNHHPVGFDYIAVANVDTEIADPSAKFSSGVAISDVLYERQMECATCHDVHNSRSGIGEKLLWESNYNSNFCCVCHLKCT
jgi:hypothetical protein